jgi:RNA polymerase sigma-70 factor (ECF subfamily)
MNIDDNVLVEQCRTGNTSSLETLVLKYQDRIYNTILRICGNYDDSAELTQETFVKVIEKIHGFEGRSSFYTWIYRIAVNLAINHCRRESRFEFSISGDELEKTKSLLGRYLEKGDSDPALIFERKECVELVQKALLKLEDAQRSILVLRDIEAMSYEQIAQVLQIELGTVKSRISRARSTLKEILESVIQ